MLGARTRIGYALRLVLLVGAYVVTARAGLGLDAVSGFATLVWAPTGIALAALLRRGSLWPGVLLGAFLANWWNGAPLAVAAGIGVGNTLEAVVGATALRAVSFDPRLGRLRDVLALAAIALGSTLISPSVGVMSLDLGGLLPADAAGRTWRAWWVGDVLGALVVAPLLLVWGQRPARPRSRRWRVEAVGLCAVLLAVSAGVFFDPLSLAALPLQEAYLPFPVLMWAALRFRQVGAITASFIASAIAVGGTALGHGPFAATRLSEGLLALQSFMGIKAVTVMLLGAAIAERDRVGEALEGAVRMRDDFLAVAGHELRTPLAALLIRIQGIARLLRDDPTAQRFSERLARANQSALRLQRLVDQLLDVSRISAGRLVLEREPVDLVELAREVVGRFVEGLPAPVPIELQGEPGVVGRWDRSRLDQVISNLLGNAVKYGAGRPVRVDVQRVEGAAVLKVTDQGIGIPADQQERIFDRYERAASDREFGGLGLGLWISRQIVEAMGGRIGVQSEQGKGSVFSIRLPSD